MLVVVLEGGNDALVHGLGEGGDVGRQQNEIDGLKDATDVGMVSAVVQEEGHLPLLPGEDLVQLVQPGAEDVASHRGLLAWVDGSPLAAEAC